MGCMGIGLERFIAMLSGFKITYKELYNTIVLLRKEKRVD